MKKNIRVKKSKTGVYSLILDLSGEKVNILKSAVLQEISANLKELAKDKELKCLVIESAKKGNFIAGADINEIKNITEKDEAFSLVQQGQMIISEFAELNCPTICVISGSCMGGGTELALACDYRVAIIDDKTKIALPEVNLGIIPGFGGTQRLPRLIGLSRSLPLILTGKAIDAKKAYKLGVVDDFFPAEQKKEKLKKFISTILSEKDATKIINKRKQKFPFIDKFNFLVPLVCAKAKKNVLAKTQGHYPAPLKAIEVVKKGLGKDINAALKIELDAFVDLVIKQSSKNLIDLFFISEKAKKVTFAKKNSEVKKIDKAAVLGAGVMGGGIAWFFTKLDIRVRLKDLNLKAIALGYQQVEKIYTTLVKIRKYKTNQALLKKGLISYSLDYQGFANTDIIVEAIIEDMKIKKASFKELEKHINENTIIASNTSSLSINEMAKSLEKPKRFIGMHFFNPVNRMPLVEVIPAQETNTETIETIFSLCRKAGKTPILVKDAPGFLVNRILIPYINEAGYLLAEHQDLENIDKIVSEFGMPMGPFTLADNVGIDVGYKVAKILEKSFGKRMKVSDLLEQTYQAKFLGKKTGLGFYDYKNQGKINLKLKDFYKNEAKTYSSEQIIDRLILVMVNEAAKCLEEKIIADHELLDLAMVMGTGFPAFRGGVMKYADNRGIANIVAKLELMAKNICQERFKPAKLLQDMAKNGKSFY